MNKILTTFGPRVVGSVVSFLAGWIYVHTKGMIQIDATQVVEVGSGMLVAYAAAHRATSAVVNPGDAAEGRLAAAEKTAVDTGSAPVPAPPGH